MRSLLSMGIALLLASLTAATPAFAQSLILRPAAVPLSGSIGQSVKQTLTLQNETDQPMEFELQAQDVVVRDGKRAFVEAGKIAGSIAATAVLQPRRVQVPAHGSASADVMFTLPPGMQHRAVVALFKGVTPVQSGGRRTLLSLGTLFTFSVSDSASVTGRLEVQAPGANASGSFTGQLTNDGTEPVIPSGTVVLMDAHGRMVGRSAFAPRRLLPGESAALVADYPGELDSGNYRAVATFDIAGKPFTLTSPVIVP